MSKLIEPGVFRCAVPELEPALKRVVPAAGKDPQDVALPQLHGVLLHAGESGRRVSAGDFSTTVSVAVVATGEGRLLIDAKRLKGLLTQAVKKRKKATLVAEVTVAADGEAMLRVGPPDDPAAFEAPLEALNLANYPILTEPSPQRAVVARELLVAGMAHAHSATGKEGLVRWVPCVALLFEEEGLVRVLGCDGLTIGEAVLPATVTASADAADGVLASAELLARAFGDVQSDRVAIGWAFGERLSMTCGNVTVTTAAEEAGRKDGFPVARARAALEAERAATTAVLAAPLLLRDLRFAVSAGAANVELRLDGEGVRIRAALKERGDEVTAPPIPVEVEGAGAGVFERKRLEPVLKALGDATVVVELLAQGKGVLVTAGAPGEEGGQLRFRVTPVRGER